MKKFLNKIGAFLLGILVVVLVGVLLPTTPRSSQSLLFAKRDKDSLLKNVKGNRLILVGGSNLSFGINSQMILDSLHLQPVNTGVHAAIGLSFMMKSTLQYVKQGDIVILVPEYQQYLDDCAFGGEELLRTALDVDRSSISTLSLRQWENIYTFLPKYALSKFRPEEYNTSNLDVIYLRNSFNQYGDAVAHHSQPIRRDQHPVPRIADSAEEEIWNEIEAFRKSVEETGAKLYVSYPPFDKTSYKNSSDEISKIKNRLEKDKYKILGVPGRFKMDDGDFYEMPYHLNKEGAKKRTMYLIEYLRKM